jgi:Nif-specific regulatory protein
MSPKLIVIAGSLRGTTFAMEGDTLVIGREASCEVPLVEPSVSRRHCIIRRAAEGFTIFDLDSFNGTFVNGVPVKEQVLAHSDEVSVGDTLLLFLTHEQEVVPASLGFTPISEEDLNARSTIQLERKDARYLHPDSLLAALPAADTVTRHLNTLLRISGLVISIRDSEELQRRLLEALVSDIPAQRAAILLGDKDGGEFISAQGWDGSPGTVKSVRVSRTVTRHVLREGVSILSNDVVGGSHPGSESLIASNVHSLMCVPLVVAGKTFGVIYLDATDPTVVFDEEHLQLLTAVGGIASVALENVRTFEHLREENRRLRDDSGVSTSIIGESASMRRVGELIARVAPQESTLLIRGESGTGKELAARAVHERSPRRVKSFVAINCATLTENLLESELFGYERGAFTGAVSTKKGKLEVAQGGTLFLDEVGELPLPVQAKLLRVLQEREFERLGSTRSMKADVRIIAATNKDLEAAVRQGTFRDDLYYRLNVISLKIPALSERREDIPLLTNYFLSKYSRKCKRRVMGISPEAHACLRDYWWPGNVRELENAIEYAVVLGTAELITPEDLPETVVAGRQSSQNSTLKFYQAVIDFKKQLVLNALRESHGNITEAARLLGIHPPNNLHRIINNLGLRDAL